MTEPHKQSESTKGDAARPDPVKPDDLDAVIHERARLSIVSALAVAPLLSFNELKAMLGLTDGNLSVHARTLEAAGYIVVEKSFQGRRPHTTMQLTVAGRKAFARYLETLQQIVDRGARVARQTTRDKSAHDKPSQGKEPKSRHHPDRENPS